MGCRGILFGLESFRRHMDNGRWLFQLGMEQAGYLTAGGEMPPPGIDATNVREIVQRFEPRVVIFWPRYEWDPGEWGGCEVTPAHCFDEWEYLLERDDILRVAVFHDAGSARKEQVRWHQEFRPHVYLTWYHPQSVVDLAPHVPYGSIVRTYHVVDPATTPVVRERDGGIVISGAYVPDVYPLRTRACLAVADGTLGPRAVRLEHPGYAQTGTRSHEFAVELAKYRVAVCTASSYKFALRKIFEATAAGCRVVTDLPTYDHLPEIDGNLIRVRSDVSIADLRAICEEGCEAWDLDRQLHFAKAALWRYDWRREARYLADTLE